MPLERNPLEMLDRHIEAILHVPISDRAIRRRTRNRGLLIALPFGILIGAVTLNSSSQEGLLSAIGLSERSSDRQADKPAERPPRPVSTASSASAVRSSALPAPQQQRQLENQARLATIGEPRRSRPSRARGDSVQSGQTAAAQSPAAQEPQEASAFPQASANVLPTYPEKSSEKSDARPEVAPTAQSDSRLATIDAIRDLRLQ
jgi:type IV secretory pathway VirB10-like protein